VEDSHLINMGRSLTAEQTLDGVHLTDDGARNWRGAIKNTVVAGDSWMI
jgi:hypothetical protein